MGVSGRCVRLAVWKLERWPGAAVPSWRAFFVSVGTWRRAAKRGRVRKSAGRVLVVVVSGAAATVSGRVAVGSLNADGMPCVMSGREDVRPVVVMSGAAVMVSAVERMPSDVVR